MEEEDNQKKKKFIRSPVRDFPKHTLEEVLVIAKAIQDKNAGNPMKRLLVANAIGRKPTSPGFRDLLSSSFKYGLTSGTEKAENISLTSLGQNITKPTSPEMQIESKQKAVMCPKIFKKVYSHFRNGKFQRTSFFENQLETEFGVPREYVKEVSEILEKNGKYVGIIRDISGSPHIIFEDTTPIKKEEGREISKEVLEEEKSGTEFQQEEPLKEIEKTRVFIGHGKNEEIVGQLKELISYGKLMPIIAEERETTSKPVPEKVLQEMRSCFAGVIHVESEEQVFDDMGKPTNQLNGNVLIEIGAAMALYDKNIILLVKEGVKLPSNLQGLYICPYKGNKLDYKATMKLLKMFNDFK